MIPRRSIRLRQRFLDLFFEQVRIERFNQVLGNTGSLSFGKMLPVTVGGHDQNWNILRSRIASYRAKQLGSRQSGHRPIRDHEVKPVRLRHQRFLKRLPGLVAVLGFHNSAKSQRRQHASNHAADRWHVVNQQNPYRNIQRHLKNHYEA